jgi:hypothetical protein
MSKIFLKIIFQYIVAVVCVFLIGLFLQILNINLFQIFRIPMNSATIILYELAILPCLLVSTFNLLVFLVKKNRSNS